jgi:hypothetical protein
MRTMATTVLNLSEAQYDASTGKLSITVIKPGMNKSKTRFYPQEVLKASHKIFDGAKMFADHQTEAEQKSKPEGSVNNWVASVGKTFVEADGTIKAEAQVIDPAFKAKLATLKEAGLLGEMGVSIRALGEAKPVENAGHKYLHVESLLKARSVDFVTYAGAGGLVEAMESDSNNQTDVDLIDEAALRLARPDLVQLIESRIEENKAMEKTLEQVQAELTEAQATIAAKDVALAAAMTKIQESETATAKAQVAVELQKLLSESKLPAIAQERIKKQFAEAVKADGIAEAIATESEYIKSLGVKPGSGVKNMGAEQNGTEHQEADKDEKAKRAKLVEAYIGMGLSKEEAEMAAV